MKSLLKWVGVVAVVGLLANSARAENSLTIGKVKSVNADNKEFVLTDNTGKDFAIKLAEDVVINRGGTESGTGLKADDSVHICYEKGQKELTAHYILVKEGDTKDCQLVDGTFKSYDADRKEFTFTDGQGKDWTHAMGGASVRMNMQDSKIENVKNGDHTLAVVEQVGDKRTVKAVMANRGK